jgi:hypothetical protein
MSVESGGPARPLSFARSAPTGRGWSSGVGVTRGTSNPSIGATTTSNPGQAGIGLLLFAIAMLRHPRFGRVFGSVGIVLIVALLVLNLAAFPIPPEPDLGPFVALWATAMPAQTLRSVQWVKARTAPDVAVVSSSGHELQHA